MPTNPENKKNSEPALKKAAAVVTAKKNRGVVIASIVLVLGLVALVFSVVQTQAEDEPQPPQAPVEVEVPTRPSEDEPTADTNPEPAPEPAPEENPANPEAPAEDDEEATEVEGDINPADYPPGTPKDRGGLPDEFPLSSTFVPVSVDEEDGKKTINATVSNSREALLVFEMNALDHYVVSSRNVDANKTTGAWKVRGPGLPDGSTVVIAGDGTMKVRIASE